MVEATLWPPDKVAINIFLGFLTFFGCFAFFNKLCQLGKPLLKKKFNLLSIIYLSL
jgi:hypothetical protein